MCVENSLGNYYKVKKILNFNLENTDDNHNDDDDGISSS